MITTAVADAAAEATIMMAEGDMAAEAMIMMAEEATAATTSRVGPTSKERSLNTSGASLAPLFEQIQHP
jgi:hypothetical protein